MEEVVIVGAGIAGLSCMNALLDLGMQPLLIEAGTIGAEKVCGEFLAPQAINALESWNIGPIQKIQTTTLFSDKTTLQLNITAGAISRKEAELQLAKRAQALGGRIYEKTKACDINPGKLTLCKGESITTKQLVIATGRVGAKPKQFTYTGLKAHFLHDSYTPQLEMHLFKGGYFGIVPISATTSNITCLVRQHASSLALCTMNKELPWITAPVGAFGLKSVPNWPNTYWIGDAIASLPPAIGGGFAHSIHSATLAAKHLLNNDWAKHRAELESILTPQMKWAKFLHHIMLWPTASKLALSTLQRYPSITKNLLGRIGL